MLYQREDVSFNIICLNVLEDTKQFYLLMWFKKKRLEMQFNGDDVKALIKTSNCEKLLCIVKHVLTKYNLTIFHDFPKRLSFRMI